MCLICSRERAIIGVVLVCVRVLLKQTKNKWAPNVRSAFVRANGKFDLVHVELHIISCVTIPHNYSHHPCTHIYSPGKYDLVHVDYAVEDSEEAGDNDDGDNADGDNADGDVDMVGAICCVCVYEL